MSITHGPNVLASHSGKPSSTNFPPYPLTPFSLCLSMRMPRLIMLFSFPLFQHSSSPCGLSSAVKYHSSFSLSYDIDCVVSSPSSSWFSTTGGIF